MSRPLDRRRNRCPRCQRVPCRCPKNPRAATGRDSLLRAAIRWRESLTDLHTEQERTA